MACCILVEGFQMFTSRSPGSNLRHCHVLGWLGEILDPNFRQAHGLPCLLIIFLTVLSRFRQVLGSLSAIIYPRQPLLGMFSRKQWCCGMESYLMFHLTGLL